MNVSTNAWLMCTLKHRRSHLTASVLNQFLNAILRQREHIKGATERLKGAGPLFVWLGSGLNPEFRVWILQRATHLILSSCMVNLLTWYYYCSSFLCLRKLSTLCYIALWEHQHQWEWTQSLLRPLYGNQTKSKINIQHAICRHKKKRTGI